MRFEKIKKFILLLMCFLSTSSIFALEEYVSDVYKKIDTVFTAKSEPQLYDVLETNKNDSGKATYTTTAHRRSATSPLAKRHCYISPANWVGPFKLFPSVTFK